MRRELPIRLDWTADDEQYDDQPDCVRDRERDTREKCIVQSRVFRPLKVRRQKNSIESFVDELLRTSMNWTRKKRNARASSLSLEISALQASASEQTAFGKCQGNSLVAVPLTISGLQDECRC